MNILQRQADNFKVARVLLIITILSTIGMVFGIPLVLLFAPATIIAFVIGAARRLQFSLSALLFVAIWIGGVGTLFSHTENPICMALGLTGLMMLLYFLGVSLISSNIPDNLGASRSVTIANDHPTTPNP